MTKATQVFFQKDETAEKVLLLSTKEPEETQSSKSKVVEDILDLGQPANDKVDHPCDILDKAGSSQSSPDEPKSQITQLTEVPKEVSKSPKL